MKKETKDLKIILRLSKSEYDLISKAFVTKKEKHKKRKGYKIGSYVREAALNSAKRIIKP